ncbi:MAG: peptide chain release factor N(5)-glutamine methyltransferase [Eubacteriales bacterium]|nr:peptide chain release factor N(5)-glutamine methyltransferase [Eubacteriales bacterium]
MTVRDWIRKTTDSLTSGLELEREEARQEARIILEEVCGWSWADQLRLANCELDAYALMELDKILDRRLKHEPFTAIFDSAYFYGRKFRLQAATLAPRPETELLVEWALEILDQANRSLISPLRLAELCAGSGAPGLSLLAELKQQAKPAKLLLLDLSAQALDAAKANAEELGLAEDCRFEEADLFPRQAEEFDIILVNPPYIPTADLDQLMPEVKDYDPRLALDGGTDGLDFYRRLAAGIRPYLATGAALLMEHGAGQRQAICEIFKTASEESNPYISYRDDYAGWDRLIAVSYPV